MMILMDLLIVIILSRKQGIKDIKLKFFSANLNIYLIFKISCATYLAS